APRAPAPPARPAPPPGAIPDDGHEGLLHGPGILRGDDRHRGHRGRARGDLAGNRHAGRRGARAVDRHLRRGKPDLRLRPAGARQPPGHREPDGGLRRDPRPALLTLISRALMLQSAPLRIRTVTLSLIPGAAHIDLGRTILGVLFFLLFAVALNG